MTRERRRGRKEKAGEAASQSGEEVYFRFASACHGEGGEEQDGDDAIASG